MAAAYVATMATAEQAPFETAVMRSLKRTRAMYLSNYGQRPEVHEDRFGCTLTCPCM